MRKTKITDSAILSIIKQKIGSIPFFISGSYANPEYKMITDIDIFFYNKKDYRLAVHKINHSTALIDKRYAEVEDRYPVTSIDDSKNSTKVTIAGLKTATITLDLMHTNVGFPSKVLNSFDLNVCKQAITSTGKRIVDPTAKEELQVLNPSYDTFSRVSKYLNTFRLTKNSNVYEVNGIKYSVEDTLKKIIDQYLNNDTLVQDCCEKDRYLPVNALMYQAFIHHKCIKGYLNEQVLKHAPELLI